MRKLLFLFLAVASFNVHSQEVRKEIDFPMSVYDKFAQYRGAKWNEIIFTVPNKIIEVSENGKFLRYEIDGTKDKQISFLTDVEPYDCIIKVSDTKKFDVITVYFIGGTFLAYRHSQDKSDYWVYYYSEKRFEGSFKLKK